MAQATSIEWTDLSWNPIRYGQTKAPWTQRNAAENVLLKPHKLREPLSGAKAWQGLGAAAAAAGKTDGMLVFVNSTSDLFHEQIPAAYIAPVFAVMAVAKQHTFQVLTKRPERMHELMNDVFFRAEVGAYLEHGGLPLPVEPWPLPNVWLGVSIENRKWVDRADVLRDTPAAVRFISAEPLLGPLVHDYFIDNDVDGGHSCWFDPYRGPELDLTGIDWLIVGGESGPNHRRFDPQWARDLRDACRATQPEVCKYGCHNYASPASKPCDVCECYRIGEGTRFFMKQQGGARPGDSLEDLPEDLRIREFPAARAAV